MSCDEIRYWLRTLHEQHGWPWETLASTLAIGEGKHAASKVRGNSWIYPGEQVRMSRQLARIIAGELVLQKSGQRWDAVVSDPPRPVAGATRMAYDLEKNVIVWRTAPQSTGQRLPTFQRGVDAFCAATAGADDLQAKSR